MRLLRESNQLSKLQSDIGNEFSLLGSLQFCKLGSMQWKYLFVIIWGTVFYFHTISVHASLQTDKSQSRPSQPHHTWTSGLDRAYSVNTFSFRIQPLIKLIKSGDLWYTHLKKSKINIKKKSSMSKEWATLLKIHFFIFFLFTRNKD